MEHNAICQRKECGKSFYSKPSKDQKYCSRECYYIAKDSWLWNTERLEFIRQNIQKGFQFLADHFNVTILAMRGAIHQYRQQGHDVPYIRKKPIGTKVVRKGIYYIKTENGLRSTGIKVDGTPNQRLLKAMRPPKEKKPIGRPKSLDPKVKQPKEPRNNRAPKPKKVKTPKVYTPKPPKPSPRRKEPKWMQSDRPIKTSNKQESGILVPHRLNGIDPRFKGAMVPKKVA